MWLILCHFHLDKHFNAEIKSKITGTIIEFIVISATISILLQLVMEYWKRLWDRNGMPGLLCAGSDYACDDGCPGKYV